MPAGCSIEIVELVSLLCELVSAGAQFVLLSIDGRNTAYNAYLALQRQ